MITGKRIGFISSFHPPVGGGAEIYLQRLIRAMVDSENHLWTTRPEGESDRDRSDENCQIHFWGKSPEVNYSTLKAWFDLNYESMFEDILAWVQKTDCETIIISGNFIFFEQTRILVQQIQERIPVGTIIHDVPGKAFEGLLETYDQTEDWDKALELQREALLHFSRDEHSGILYAPSRLGNDYTLYNSQWVKNFYDPDDEFPNMVVHPIVERTNHHAKLGLKKVDLTIVNPLPMKGGSIFLSLAKHELRKKEMRVLSGGYNSAMQKIEPFLCIAQSGFYNGSMPRNIEIREHVENMSEVYQQTEILINPTRIEGFGMTIAEALLEGCLVATTDLPGIFESVGDAAVRIPYHAGPSEWAKQIEQMIKEPDTWQPRIKAQVEYLKQRQKDEVLTLNQFIDDVITPDASRLR